MFGFIQDDYQPIHGAACCGHVNIIWLLIDVYGIDATVKDKVSSYISTYHELC